MKNILFAGIMIIMIFSSGCLNGSNDAEKDNDLRMEKPDTELIACTADWKPVCGVDGKTYSNRCMANKVVIEYEGECDAMHICSDDEKNTKVCTKDYRPVCGSDGKTHSNGCMACSTGINSWKKGECLVDSPDDIQTICQNLGGKWLNEYNECEYISKEDCLDNGGKFNECASACRNDPEAEICTMQCVLVCSFDEVEYHTCTQEEKERKACTREYRPVCGNDGKTHSNGCMACSTGINSWKKGECEKGSP